MWIDPDRTEDVESAITREDVRRLISEGAIVRRPQMVHSRGRNRTRKAERKMGRHRAQGSRKGTRESRNASKDEWIKRVRAQRALLVELRTSKAIKPSAYRALYGQVKGGQFQGKRALQSAAMAGQRRSASK